MQEKCLERIDELDDELKVVEMPLLVEDVRGKTEMRALSTFREQFARDGKPSGESLMDLYFPFLRNAAFQC